MRLDKRNMFLQAFMESIFSYCPIILMLHSKTLNNKINPLDEKALKVVYSDFKVRLMNFQKEYFLSIYQIFKIWLLKYLNFV